MMPAVSLRGGSTVFHSSLVDSIYFNFNCQFSI